MDRIVGNDCERAAVHTRRRGEKKKEKYIYGRDLEIKRFTG